MNEDFLTICGIKLSRFHLLLVQIKNCFFFISQQCDLLAQDVVPKFQRNQIVDLTTYWYYGDLVFLIPVPDETANINSVVKPFQWMVL